MGRRAQYEMPEAVREAQRRFEEWRKSQAGRRPIPEPLWALATGLGRQHGVFRTAQALRLDSSKLMKRVRAAATPEASPAVTSKPAPHSAFVELITAAASLSCECVIEVEGPRGRMRIEWKGSTAPDLAGLSRVLWERGACFRSRHRCVSWSLSSRLTPGRASTVWRNCAARNSPRTRFPDACLSSAAGAEPRLSYWPMTARGSGWQPSGCPRGGFAGGQAVPSRRGCCEPIRRSCCWPPAIRRRKLRRNGGG